MNNEISNYDDIIDSRDVIARIEELESELVDVEGVDLRDRYDLVNFGSTFDDQYVGGMVVELGQLLDLAKQGEGYAPDWEYGEALIRDTYFTEYAQSFAEDIGALDDNASWPATCIDWEQAARELQQDYTAIEFAGITYWVR